MMKFGISKEIYKIATPIIQLQTTLADLKEDNIEESIEIILNLKLSKSQTGLVCICQDILYSTIMNFTAVEVYSKFIEQLSQPLPNILPLIMAKLFLPAIDTRTKCVHLRMLKYFFEHNLISLDDIISAIANFPMHLSNQYLLFFFAFGRFIERNHHDVFKELCLNVRKLQGLGPTFLDLIKVDFKDIISRSSESDMKWQPVEEKIFYGYVKDSYQYAARNNDRLGIRAASKKHLDELVEFSPFDPIPFDSRKCTLCQIAARCGAFKTLSWMMTMKGAFRSPDSNGNSTGAYAAASGSVTVIKAIHDRMIDVTEHLPIAANHRSIQAFEYILGLIEDEMDKQELLDKSLLVCAATNNVNALLTCLQNGASPKTKNCDGQTPLHLAAMNDNLFVVKILSMLPEFDPNVQDDAENTPLHLAAQRGNIGVINFLLKLPGLDKNLKNRYGKMAIDATQE